MTLSSITVNAVMMINNLLHLDRVKPCPLWREWQNFNYIQWSRIVYTVHSFERTSKCFINRINLTSSFKWRCSFVKNIIEAYITTKAQFSHFTVSPWRLSLLSTIHNSVIPGLCSASVKNFITELTAKLCVVRGQGWGAKK